MLAHRHKDYRQKPEKFLTAVAHSLRKLGLHISPKHDALVPVMMVNELSNSQQRRYALLYCSNRQRVVGEEPEKLDNTDCWHVSALPPMPYMYAQQGCVNLT